MNSSRKSRKRDNDKFDIDTATSHVDAKEVLSRIDAAFILAVFYS